MNDSGFYTQFVEQMVASMRKDGDRILDECLASIDYTNQTYNLHDSYGYAIFVRGERVAMKTTDQMATEGVKWYQQIIEGSEEIRRFFNAFKPSKGIDLVIAAAMPYAEVLEGATSGQHRTYKVISMSYDKLQAVADKYPGATVSIFNRKFNEY